MGVLATDKRQLIYIYSEDSGFGKKMLPYARAYGEGLRIININRENLSDTIWVEVAELLKQDFSEIFSSEVSSSISAEGKISYKACDWLKLIENKPGLLQHPIVINGLKAKQIKQRSDIYKFYDVNAGDFDKFTAAEKKA